MPSHCNGSELIKTTGGVTWLWRPWVPRGLLTILAGEAGTGKSALALHLANCVAGGHTWPDLRGMAPKARVLIADCEGAQPAWASRMQSWNCDVASLLFWGEAGLGRLQLDSPEQLAEARALVQAEGVALVIVDSLAPALGKVSATSDKAWRILEPWVELARDAPCGLLIVYHMLPKANTTKALARIAGSWAVTAAARSVIGIEQSQPGGPAKLSVIKSNLAPPPPPLVMSWVQGKLAFAPMGVQFGEAAPSPTVAPVVQQEAPTAPQSGPQPPPGLSLHQQELWRGAYNATYLAR